MWEEGEEEGEGRGGRHQDQKILQKNPKNLVLNNLM